MGEKRKEQRNAERMAEALRHRGHEPVVSGAGVHWDVSVEGPSNRSSRTHCFEYEAAIRGLVLGMNRGNARVAPKRPAAPPRSGPEYLVTLLDSGAHVVSGRTPDVELAATAVGAWARGEPMDVVAVVAPFIGARRQVQEATAAKLDPSLRRDLGGDPGYSIWVYGNGRSCRITRGRCVFFFGQQEVGTLDGSGVDAVHSWVRDGLALENLPDLGVVLERHAGHIQADPARWHWLHVLDRIQDEGDVLVPLSDLIVRLAASPVVSRFYTFSSLYRLCFSASSHYPWVGDFPVVAPVGASHNGEVVWDPARASVDGVEMDIDQAVQAIESALRDSKVEPFWGSEGDLELDRVSEALLKSGSSLKPQRVQEDQWMRVVVERGARWVKVSGKHLELGEGDTTQRVTARSKSDAIGLMVDFLEHEADLSVVSNDVRVRRR